MGTRKFRRNFSILLALLILISAFTVATATDVEIEPQSVRFEDVPANHPNFNAVQFVYGEGLMVGVSSRRFGPEQTLDRAMVVTVIYRMEGQPNVTYRPIFSDVPNGRWYSNSVTWGYDNDVVHGVGGGRFAPTNAIAQQELAAMMYRLAQSRGYHMDVPANVNISNQTNSWAVDAMRWAVHHGFISGDTPRAAATRGMTAQFVYAFSTTDFDEPAQQTPPPPPPASLAGTWDWVIIPGVTTQYYVLNANGTGTMGTPPDTIDIRWTARNGVFSVCVTPDFCGNDCIAPVEWDYALSGNNLTLTSRLLPDLIFNYIRR